MLYPRLKAEHPCHIAHTSCEQVLVSSPIVLRQVWAGTLSTAASGRKMHLTYRDVDTFDLQDDVGSVVLRTCQVESTLTSLY